MLKVGLTGGIGSGKSTACEYFQQLGVPIIDTDQIARRLVGKGQPLLARLIDEFGSAILDPHGELDRPAMRQRVFADPDSLARLEALLHPAIRADVMAQLEQLHADYVIIAIPLLLEKGWHAMVDRILVVDCDEQQQLSRASRRDHSNPAAIQQLMTQQASRQQRLAAAHDILHNEGRPESLQQQVLQLHRHYLELAKLSHDRPVS